MDTSRVDGVKAPQHFKTPMVHDHISKMLADRVPVALERVDRFYDDVPELDRPTIGPNSYGWRARPHRGRPDPRVSSTNVFEFHGLPRAQRRLLVGTAHYEVLAVRVVTERRGIAA